MANTLTVKLTVTDANGTISGATPTAGVNFSFDYTAATREEFTIAASGTKNITVSGSPRVVMVVPLSGVASVDLSDDAGTTKVPTIVDATDGGFAFLSEPNNGQSVNYMTITETGGVNTFTGVVYSWT